MEAAKSDFASDTTLFANVDSYPWDSDTEFQGGLLAILGSDPAPEQANELVLRARCFYYERKFNVSVNFDAYKEWRERNGIGPPSGPTNHGDVNSGHELAHGEALPGIAPFPLGMSGNTGGEGGAKEEQGKGTIDSAGGAAPYPTSFAQIVEMITTGKPIPGIKEIPDTVLSGQGTESKHEKRKKPWERQNT